MNNFLLRFTYLSKATLILREGDTRGIEPFPAANYSNLKPKSCPTRVFNNNRLVPMVRAHLLPSTLVYVCEKV